MNRRCRVGVLAWDSSINPSTRPRLEQRRRVHGRVVVAGNILVRQVRAVVEGEAAPSVDAVLGIEAKPAVRLARRVERV